MRFITIQPYEIYCDNDCGSKTMIVIKEGGSIYTGISKAMETIGWFSEYDERDPSRTKIYCPECYDKLFGRKLLLD